MPAREGRQKRGEGHVSQRRRRQPAAPRLPEPGPRAARGRPDRRAGVQGGRGPRGRRGGPAAGGGRARRPDRRRAAALRLLRPPRRGARGLRQARRLGDPLPRRGGPRADHPAAGRGREAALAPRHVRRGVHLPARADEGAGQGHAAQHPAGGRLLRPSALGRRLPDPRRLPGRPCRPDPTRDSRAGQTRLHIRPDRRAPVRRPARPEDARWLSAARQRRRRDDRPHDRARQRRDRRLRQAGRHVRPAHLPGQ